MWLLVSVNPRHLQGSAVSHTSSSRKTHIQAVWKPPENPPQRVQFLWVHITTFDCRMSVQIKDMTGISCSKCADKFWYLWVAFWSVMFPYLSIWRCVLLCCCSVTVVHEYKTYWVRIPGPVVFVRGGENVGAVLSWCRIREDKLPLTLFDWQMVYRKSRPENTFWSGAQKET